MKGDDELTKEIVIVAGGNGVGKTTFARQFLLEYPYEFLNADEIAKELSPHEPTEKKISAGKIFFQNLHDLIEQEKSIVIESTLSGHYLLKFFELWQQKNYQTQIIFIFVDTPEILIERIQNRVMKGGHFVPDEDVRRRFERGKKNFWLFYKNLADSWSLFYNMNDSFLQFATGEKDKIVVVDEDLFERFLGSVK